ncbi:tetratricopeptide (TPR) repeat protein [Catalinimonas alkaloidigena]|uniref:tetratricopeptide repeat protein n=1 Tax=Catalinimonas alkaloidigena TaxID=1075417 RepID=UPI002405274D|nr:tetratricopeptide repeat protein [Catalinimonas alkaloidigena]MDF9797503.1 tetratricopeptide (TPR) repeat protein [Catalinimonas alkaloidigena]
MKVLINVCLFLFSVLSLPAQDLKERPSELYEQASIFYQNNQLSSALACLDLAVAKSREYVDAYLLRAQVKEKMDDLSGAITDYSISIFIKPDLIDARFKRAQLYFEKARYHDALEDFHLLLQLPPGETSKVYFKGKNDNSGFSVTGITTLQSHINAEIYNYLGLTHLKLNNIDSARFYIHQAITIEPEEADYHVNKGLLMETDLDTLSAITAYQKALSYQNDHTVALANLSKLTKKSQYHELVRASYDLAVNEQGSYQAFFNRGVLRQSLGKNGKAIDDFTQAISIGGTNAEVLLLRAYSKEKELNLKGAIEDYTVAIKFDPLLIKAFINRGNAYYKLKKYTEAVTDYNTALQLDASLAKVYYNRGLALYLSGKPQQACKDLNKALEMNFYSAEAPIQAYCLSSN